MIKDNITSNLKLGFFLVIVVVSINGCKEINQEGVKASHAEFYKKHINCLNELADSLFGMGNEQNKDFSVEEMGEIIKACSVCDNEIQSSSFKRPFRYFRELGREFVLFYPDMEDAKCTSTSLLVYKDSDNSTSGSIFLDNDQRWKVNVESASPCF
jgi:hypothetical protein